ncbi:MAG: polysaccharide pyruvyl transferase family protein [Novosphingobium sp.]
MAASSFDAAGGQARRQVFVCGDLHNLGDLKLLLQNLALTRGRGGVVRRWAPLPAAVERQVAAAGGELVSGRAILGFARKAFGAQIVLGGGQLVRDNVSIAALVGLLFAVFSARFGGGELVTRGLGVSAIRSRLRRVLWRAILAHCQVVNLRDEHSDHNLARLLPGKARAIHADMVFLPTRGKHAITPGRADRRWIVVAPCADTSEGRSIEGGALDVVITEALRRLPHAALVIACHDPRESMDKAVAVRLLMHWSDREIFVLDDYNLSALVALYREAALVVTNRLHSLIFSVLADAPVLVVEDGTAKVRMVADLFAVPVMPQEDRGAASACLDAALSFDNAARGRMRQELGLKAQRNL